MDRNKIKGMLSRMVEKSEKIPRSFHCELQLHNRFLTSEDNSEVHSHFGCSKDCCYLYWRFLKHSRYTTKATHSRIHVGCSFPFAPSNGGQGQYSSIINVLKTIDVDLTNVIQEKAKQIVYQSKVLPSNSQTNVDDMSYSIFSGGDPTQVSNSSTQTPDRRSRSRREW